MDDDDMVTAGVLCDPGEAYGGMRFEKEGEDNGLNLPMVIIKQADCPQPAKT